MIRLLGRRSAPSSLPALAAALVVATLCLVPGSSASATTAAPTRLSRLLDGPTPAPASCGHAATSVYGGHKSFGTYRGDLWLGLGQSSSFAKPLMTDVNRDGVQDAVVSMTCTAGGVSWPDWVLVYTGRARLVGAINLGSRSDTQEHASITRIVRRDGRVRVHWISYEGAAFNPRYRVGTLGKVDGRWRLVDVHLDPPRWTAAPGRIGPFRVGRSAQSLRDLGLVRRSTSEYCGMKWDTRNVPSRFWAEFREGDPDDVDGAWAPKTDRIDRAYTRTAAGIGPGSYVSDLRAAYGSRLVKVDDVMVEGGPIDFFAIFGTGGALLFQVPDVQSPDPWDEVAGIEAAKGHDRSSLRVIVGGC